MRLHTQLRKDSKCITVNSKHPSNLSGENRSDQGLLGMEGVNDENYFVVLTLDYA